MKNSLCFLFVFAGLPLVAADLKSSTVHPMTSTTQVGNDPELSFDENFHLSIAYNSGSFNLNLADPSALVTEPQAGIYEDNKPASGIFLEAVPER